MKAPAKLHRFGTGSGAFGEKPPSLPTVFAFMQRTQALNLGIAGAGDGIWLRDCHARCGSKKAASTQKKFVSFPTFFVVQKNGKRLVAARESVAKSKIRGAGR